MNKTNHDCSTKDQLKELSHRIIKLMREQNLTLALAESCTGGLISHQLTNVPGASDVLLVSWVVYTNQAKHDCLNIARSLLETHGAVSSKVAEQLALNAQKKAQADYAMSVTGLAGPSDGTLDCPVGRVFIGFAHHEQCFYNKYNFLGTREEIKRKAACELLQILLSSLLKK